MAGWRIYYADGSVFNGETGLNWKAAPLEGVQVVVVREPPSDPAPDRHATGFVGCGRGDFTFYTGVDNYDPLSYGEAKRGLLMPDIEYHAIWDRAYGDS